MKLKLLLCLALVLSGGLSGCSSIHPTLAANQTTAPLYLHFGFDLGQGVKRFLSTRIHPGQAIFVGGDGFWELKGKIYQRGTNLVADLMGGNGQESQFYHGNITLEKPFFAQGGVLSGGAGLCWFVVSTNSDSRAIVERVNTMLGLTNSPIRHSNVASQFSSVVTNTPNQINSNTGLPPGPMLIDPRTGLPLKRGSKP